jgi:hypothetical protein
MAKRRAGASGRRKGAALGRGGMAVLVHTVKRSAQDPTGEKGKEKSIPAKIFSAATRV